MENIKTLKLIATYYRVSTSTQEEQQTIKTQISAVKEFAEKTGCTIVKEYVDDGWSGDMLARPALDELRQDAKDKKWEAVLMYDPDRLARRYSYQELVMDELKEAGIEIIFVTISAPKNSEDKILHGVRGLFAEYERAKISERFRLGKLRKVKEGHLLVSEPLYGYNYVPRKENIHGYYVINEIEADVVRKVFNWIGDEGLTLKKAVLRLQEQGIKPRRSKREVWNTSTLGHLLRNKAYIGEARWGSSYAVVPERPLKHEKYKKMKKTSRKIRPEEEWYTIPVPPLIDRDIFDKAQRQLEVNFSMSKRNKVNDYLLANRIHCTCGSRRTGEGPQKGKYLYYRCSQRVNTYPFPPTCKETGIDARIADEKVWDKIADLMSSPELLAGQITRWSKSKVVKNESSVYDTESLKKEITKLENQQNRYNQAYGAEVFTLEELKKYTEPINERIQALKSQIANNTQIKTETENNLPNQEEVESFASESRKVLKNLSFDAKRGIMMNVIDKIVGTKNELQINGHIPIISPYVKHQTIHRNRRSPKRR